MRLHSRLNDPHNNHLSGARVKLHAHIRAESSDGCLNASYKMLALCFGLFNGRPQCKSKGLAARPIMSSELPWMLHVYSFSAPWIEHHPSSVHRMQGQNRSSTLRIG